MTSPHIRLVLAALALLISPRRPEAGGGNPPIALGPLGGTAQAVLVDPLDRSVILVSTFEQGILRSTDGGVTYAQFGSGLGGFAVELDADPAVATTFYALVDAQIYRSVDSGANWSPLALVAASGLRSLAVAGSTLLASDVGALYRSIDAGATWTTAASGVVFEHVVFAPSDPQIAYLAHLNGVDRSSDGGATFTPTAGLTSWAKALLVDPADPDLVYIGGVFGNMSRTTDGGATSSSINSGYSTSSTQFLFFQPGSSSRIFAGALDGLWRTSDAGTSWKPVNQGLGQVPPIPNDLDFVPGGDTLLATDGGFFRLPGNQPPWALAGFPNLALLDAAIAGPGGDRLVSSFQGVYRGAPLAMLTKTPFFFDFGGHTDVIVVDPGDPERWLAGGVGSFIDNALVRVLTNGGADVTNAYEQFGGGHVETIAFHPSDPDVMLAGISPNGFGGEGLIRSLDRGDAWTAVSGTNDWPVIAVAFDPADPNHAVAARLDHRWAESFDGGASFILHGPWPGSGAAIEILFAFDPFAPGVWYRATDFDGLQRSDDGGATWTVLGTTAAFASDLVFHPSVAGLLWFSDGAGQVLASSDRGATWTPVFTTAGGANATGLAFDESTNALLLATDGESAWELPCASPFAVLDGATAGSGGFVPRHHAAGGLPVIGNGSFALAGEALLGGSSGVLVGSTVDPALPLFGGLLRAAPPFDLALAFAARGVGAGAGSFELAVPVPSDGALAGIVFFSQFGVFDAGGAFPVVLSNGLATTLLP